MSYIVDDTVSIPLDLITDSSYLIPTMVARSQIQARARRPLIT